MPALLVGLDVGTTASKAVVFDVAGQVVASGSAETPWVHRAAGIEMDVPALTASAVEALATAVALAPEGPVVGVGITSMAESGVLLSAHGEPMAPVIAWHDSRDAPEAAELSAAIGADTFARHTGLPLRTQWALTKHRWLLAHHPQVRHAVRRLNIAEWLVRSLGGDEATEQSLASRTGWLELRSRQWWSDTLEWSGATASLMPELVTAGTPLGTVGADVAVPRLTGAVLTLAGHDHQAAAVGAGAFNPGDELDSCGTAEALVRTIPAGLDLTSVTALAADGITTGWHAMRGCWCLLGATQGGLALQRILALLGSSEDDIERLDRDALSAEIEGLAIDGLDTSSLSISGVTTGTTPGALWRVAVEAVTSQAWEIHAAMSKVAGDHSALVVTGGWSRSKALLEVKRDVFGVLVTRASIEAGARGAALFAGLAAGVFADTQDFWCLD